jgi:hypothetical protein
MSTFLKWRYKTTDRRAVFPSLQNAAEVRLHSSQGFSILFLCKICLNSI